MRLIVINISSDLKHHLSFVTMILLMKVRKLTATCNALQDVKRLDENKSQEKPALLTVAERFIHLEPLYT